MLIYNNFVNNRCNVCFTNYQTQPFTETKIICGKCKLIKYCTVAHQQVDLKMHSQFCDVITQMMRVTNTKHFLECAGTFLLNDRSADKRLHVINFERRIECAYSITRKLLHRELMYHERIMLQQPNVCNVCFEHEDSKKLTFCQGCHQIAYCSKEHEDQDREKHSKWCSGYRLNFILNDKKPSMSVIENIPELDEDDLKSLPKDCFQLASKVLGINVRNPSADGPAMELLEEIEHIKLASCFSWVGTVLYALHTTQMIDALQNQLNIYVVGAEVESIFFDSTTAAALFSHIPKLRVLRLHFIGPEVTAFDDTKFIYQDKRSLECYYHRQLYHELTEGRLMHHPHLFMAFNCGFLDHFDTWNKTMQCMLGFINIPIAFTSYTHDEAIEDCTQMLHASHGAKLREKLVFAKRATMNPFRDLKPLRNPERLNEKDELYYCNGYLSIAIAKK